MHPLFVSLFPHIQCPVAGGVSIAEKHLRTNVFAVVGTGENPAWPHDKVWWSPSSPHPHLHTGVRSTPLAADHCLCCGNGRYRLRGKVPPPRYLNPRGPAYNWTGVGPFGELGSPER